MKRIINTRIARTINAVVGENRDRSNTYNTHAATVKRRSFQQVRAIDVTFAIRLIFQRYVAHGLPLSCSGARGDAVTQEI